jgi:8-oxo-dGTP pyrophosphatase MutT (NUDIX family)
MPAAPSAPCPEPGPLQGTSLPPARIIADALEPLLRSRPPRTVSRPSRRAGVLLLLYDRDGRPHVVRTKRTEHLLHHRGQVCLPGGRWEEEDPDLRDTALRETEEELGIASSAVELLGALPALHTFVSAILIVPFVGILDPRPTMRPNPNEIAEVLEYPIAALDVAERHVEWRRDGAVYRGYAYDMDGHTIWGATAMILHSLLELIRTEAA